MRTPITDAEQHAPLGIVEGFGAHRDSAEADLAAHGITLPLAQRGELLQKQGCSDSVLLVVRDETGAPAAAAGVAMWPKRAMPGHRINFVQRLSATARADIDAILCSRLAQWAHSDRRCLRLTIELFDRDGERRTRMGETLRSLGFERAERQRIYRRTLALELAPGKDALFAGLSAKARRDIKVATKRGLEVRPVDDPALADRMGALMDGVFDRTGSGAPRMPWASVVRISARDPRRSRVSGLFDPKAKGSDCLVAFAWGAVHGEYATYEAGARSRAASLGNTPLGYAPLWDLVTWAHDTGAAWFDFGGITAGTDATPDDPVGGISDFKRSFRGHEVEVGEEWVLTPRPIRARIARALTVAAQGVVPRNLLAGMKSRVRPSD